MRFTSSKILGVALALIILITCSANLSAQTPASVAPTTSVARVTQAVNESNRVTLKGNTHPLANGKNESGVAPDSLPMERMLLVLKRSPDQQAALKAFIEGQQSKSSPNFHQWLTPEQFGQQYGVADSDIQAVTSWLQTHGFTVNRVAAGKMLIEFSGTAGQVHEAFQTQIHKYTVKGQDHWANASDPTIPAALMPVIAGVNTLNNFGKKATIEKRGAATRTTVSGGGAGSPLVVTGCPAGFGTMLPSTTNCFGVGPADFNAIYNVPATVGGAAAGTGQTIAVVGDSDICTGSPLPAGCTADDVLNFRTLFGLPTGGATNAPKIIVDGADPGINGDELEGDLDVEYSGAIAPNAQILFVVAADTETSAGIDLAAERIVDYNLAPVLNESFGACEFNLGNSGNQFYSDLWAQAAAQGITVTISTGDTGSASCDDGSGLDVAENGLTVSGIASTPFNVAAGGTDFDFTAAGYPQNFWNTTSGANLRTVKGYIPETTWNDSCGQPGVAGCNALTLSSSSPLLVLEGGGGGQSNCPVQDEFGDCTESYAKPSWQTGSGVPNDMVRDIPDISLFSSLGLLSGSFYVVCESDLGGDCVNGGSGFSFIPVGGTSAAAPAFSAIMALVNQNMIANGKSGRQGNANFVLYPMSASQTESSCNSSLIPASNCVFNDVSKGNNSQPCVATSFNCSNTTANSQTVGVLVTENDPPFANGAVGFSSTSGYDLATGLGSVNVTNLVNGWPAAVGAFTPTSTTLTMSPLLSTCPAGTPAGITSCISIVHGATVTSNITVTGGTAISGNASLIGTCQTATPNCFLGGTNTAGVDRFDAISGNTDVYPLTNGSITGATTQELVGGTYNVTAHYAGDGIHGASDSTTPIQVHVTPEGSVATVTVFGGVSASSAPYGSGITIRTDINGSSSGFETATGQVTLNDTFPGWTPVVLSLNSDGHVEYNAPNANFPGNNNIALTIPALGTGSHNFSASYAGDASYNASTSAGVPFTITQAPTASAITTSPTSVAPNTNFTLTATVITSSFGNAPTGTVSFFAGSTLLGTAPAVAIPIAGNGNTGASFVGAMATLTTAKITATSSITATYSGDTNYTASPASPAVTVSTTAAATFTVSSASNPTVVAGNPATSVITVAPTGGFTGTVALTCSVAPTNLTSTPTCSFSAPSIVLGVSQTSTLTVTTTATTSPTTYTVTVTGTSGATVVTAPVTVTVTTNGTFTLTSTAVTIATPGQSGTSTITATGTGGFTGAISLSCSVTASGATDPPTCSVGGPINLTSSTTTGTATLTVNTTAAASVPFMPTNNLRPNTRWIVGTGAAATLLLVMLMCFAPARKRRPVVVLASLFIFVGLAVAGCGGSSGGGGTPNPGTTPGTYTATVTGATGNITSSTAVTVTVQ
jgi:trimeric autotransporter adhesin